MKKLTLLLMMLLTTIGTWAQEVPTGVLGVGDDATTLEVGKWYFLYNNGSKRYIKEDGSNALKQTSTSPTGLDATEGAGYLFTLVAEGDKYYIKTGLGNYVKAPSSSARGTGASPTASWALSISSIADGHFTIGNGTYKLTAPTDGTDPKGGTAATVGSIGDWTFRVANAAAPTDLTGKALYNYQMNKLGFMRLHCRRNMNSWLTTTAAGSAKCTTNSSDLTSVWYATKSGEGYNLRSAYTGQYLKDGFSEPTGSPATLYIRFSPNNKGDEAFVNISSKEEFGNKCLNLMNDHTSITTWTSEGDPGCDWAIELVEDIDLQTVRDNINAATGYVPQLTDGRYYRITNVNNGKCMTETGSGVRAMNTDATNFSQLWKATLNSNNKVSFRNAFSNNYIQNQSNLSNIYKTASTEASHFVVSTGADEWEYSWYITNTNGNDKGMHCDNSSNVVLWYNSNSNNKWAFVEVNVTDDEIAAAQESYQIYTDAVTNQATYQAALDALFTDKACSQLKSDIQALTDEQLAANADYATLPKAIKEMVLKVKNNTWAYTTDKSKVTDAYEKFFRVADYKIYSNHQKMSWREYTGQSNAYGKLSNPTSIVLNSGEVAYIYVDQDPKAECTLQVEVVPTEGVPGGHQTGICTDLHKGFNVIQATEQSLLYIFYQLDNPEKFLADYPDIKVHVEGGGVQGYFDVTRGMTNQDWKNMIDMDMMQHDKCPVINLKSKNLVFAMHTQLVKDAIAEAHRLEGDAMEDVELLLHVWNTICANEERYQGLEEFEGRFNNIWNVFSVNYNYMFATTYGTYYHENTLSGCMNYYNNRRFTSDGNGGGPFWGPSHEMGHNHQNTICMVGCMESSNNLFSNINTHEGGICNTRYDAPATNFDNYFALGKEWNDRGIDINCRLYTQLYLYFHAQKHDERFLQKLFKELRKDPMSKGTWNGSLTATTSDGEVIQGGNAVSGAQDYLHFAKKVCDVAQADLSEFFEAYGMFVPENNHFVGDYANYFVTTTQKEIDAAKAYMKKYPKKLGNIMFINDRQERHEADADNIFKFVPRADGLRWSASGSGETNGYYQTACNGGDYESYDGHTEYDVDGDYYTVSGSTISFKGTGYLGHKVYDLDGNFIWAVNKKSATIPAPLRSMFPDQVVVVAAQQNMTDVPCPYYKSGTSPVYKMQVSFADGTSKQWWADDNIDAYLPANAFAVVGSANAPEALLGSTNVINTDGTAQKLVIDGNLPAHLPAATAQQLTFTKAGEGFQALTLPFDVQNATTIADGVMQKASTVAAGQPVVIEGAANYVLNNVTVNAGDYTTTANAYVLSADAKQTEQVAEATAFTYDFGSSFSITTADAINEILSAPDADTQKVFDMNGRRVSSVRQGVYIINGKKVLVK
ncbi:MAG: hypothetical protein HUK02_03240 [Bacteroidaceae bacterium]|nr:hypothetical protein [Bacteroidaceae bacterium]